MTSSQMESLNRKTRIFLRLQAGDRPRAIADAERVCIQYVSKVAIDNGIRRRSILPTEAQKAWKQISANLDRWNAEHGRKLPKDKSCLH